MHTFVGRPTRWRLPFALLLLVVLAGAALALHAAVAPSTTPRRTIDWQHPVQVPGPGMAHSGVGSATTGDIVTPLGRSNALAVLPQANFPGNCYRGVAYTVSHNGVSVWSWTGANTRATTSYLWCPRWAGDSIGLNFGYGRAYLIASRHGCEWIGVGRNATGAQVGGAMISTSYQPGGQKEAFDGEQEKEYLLCPNSGFVWDYSLTLPGDGKYAVGMDAFDYSEDTHAIVWSPVF